MTSPCWRTLLFFACLIASYHASGEDAATPPRVRVEFRRAEKTPADGLVEAAVAIGPRKIYLHKEPDATNHDIAQARAIVDRSSRPAVLVLFTPDGAKKMERLSEEHKDRPLAILVDGQVVAAPEVRTVISEQAVISGNFTQAEIDALVAFINTDVYYEKPKNPANNE